MTIGAVKLADGRTKSMGLLPKLMGAMLTPVLISFGVIAYIYFFHMKEMVSSTMTEMEDMNATVVAEMEEMSSVATREGIQTLNELGERMIREKARDVARQLEIYIKSHPRSTIPALREDKELKIIAVQPVGDTGYTAVHDNGAINHFHINPKIVGMNLRTLAERFPEFWKILEASLKGDAQGYYDWEDADGAVRPKYMFIAPVAGTNLRVAATTYIDEFSAPARHVEKKLEEIHDRTEKKLLVAAGKTLDRFRATSQRTLNILLVVVVLSLAAIIFLTFWFSRTIIRPILDLTRVANRISMGDLDTTVEVKSRDEVGLLAESFSRMQESLRAAIVRLKKKRAEL
ncbi:MAG: HAMP domain-containing protein [Proteobacteria bacterium]|nr:HAMP domain-containing protein [Pseudomonadota bacterium]NIS69456.1 HAMP domain-containing protein [Pseudomonadota bacterium]